jgi:hypothetical protein
MKNTLEFVAPLTVVAGSSSNSVDFTPLKGKVIGCAIFTKGGTNAGMVRAVIKDNTGTEISRLQAIENYRSREAEYLKGAKPLNIETGSRTFTYEVIATSNFDTDLVTDLIFIYEPESCA